MLIKQIALGFLGLCSGFAVAAGTFAFITMLGIIPRLAARTHTANHVYLYENMIIWGGALGNIWFIYLFPLRLSVILLCMYGVFAGIYVGCLVMALAEMLRVLPITVNRLQINEGFPFIAAAIAAGKLAGTLYQYFY